MVAVEGPILQTWSHLVVIIIKKGKRKTPQVQSFRVAEA
jgi:hypothetical protein